MSWLKRLEQRLESFFEGRFGGDNPPELELLYQKVLPECLLEGQLGTYAPNLFVFPRPWEPTVLAYFIQEKGWRTVGPIEGLPGFRPHCFFAGLDQKPGVGLVEVVEGLGQGKAVACPETGIIYGRGEQADLKVGFRGVSRVEARITPEGDGFLLEHRGRKGHLESGQLLRLGPSTLRVWRLNP